MPSAMSRPIDPVGSAGMSATCAPSPSFMMAPLPNCFSIWLNARSIARSRFTSMPMSRPSPARGTCCVCRERTDCSETWAESPAARSALFQPLPMGGDVTTVTVVDIPAPESAPHPVGRYTAEQYFRLVDNGLLAPDDRVELLEAVVVSMAPQNSAHASGITRVNRALMRA